MPTQWGAIIVCGGKSSRMGTAKAWLPFGSELILPRIVRIVGEAIAGPIVVVAARGQALPPLVGEIAVVVDEQEDCGPLEGLRVGLAALRGRAGVAGASACAYAVSCDVPLLKPELIRRICAALDEEPSLAAAVPRCGGFLHPLAAAYRIEAVLPHVERLVAARKLRAAGLFEEIRTRIVDEAELRVLDPSLAGLRTMNTPEEYEAALRIAGLASG
ncbi:MAG: molybdenum cofactor guanylyltransferase [Planctomycetia bacterium]|nr:molybdenum cofactor guanylyltransferase [Planctomycetia bacterium]